MPCYRCGTRQLDPVRGPSPWKRGVRAARQVLVCPGCQASHDWQADLDRCTRCGGTRLTRRLGEIECHDCGFVTQPEEPGDAAADATAAAGAGTAPGLAAEVALALERVLGRGAGAQV